MSGERVGRITFTPDEPAQDGRKVMVGIACGGSVRIETTLALIALAKGWPGELMLNAARGPYVHWTRETLLGDAITEGCSHLLMVDTDVVFPMDALALLLAVGKPIVGAHYNQKHLNLVRADDGVVTIGPLTSTVKLPGDGPYGYASEGLAPLLEAGEPFPCAAVATGLMLIDCNAVSALPRPWFYCEDGEGEDIYFCRIAREAGLEVWCHPGVRVGHIGDYIY